jgi:hypothetical protein
LRDNLGRCEIAGMNKTLRSLPILLVLAVAQILPFTLNPCRAAGSGANSDLAKNLIGMWMLVSRADGSEITGAGSRLKVYTGSHWLVTEAKYPGGRVTAHHGGSYSVAGDILTTTTEYALPSMLNLVGDIRQFRITVEGDIYTQTGLGNSYSETWRRVKEPAP